MKFLNTKSVKIIVILVFIVVSFFINYNSYKPVEFTSFITNKTYSAPANQAFEDENFYKCVIDAYNKDNNASKPYTANLTDEELLQVKNIDGGGKQISSVIGIEKLINLTSLGLSYQPTSIDLSKNTNLTDLYLINNKLMSIDLSKNTKLKHLYLSGNQLSSIDLSKNSNLTQLYLDGNRLTSIDLSKNPNLIWLNLGTNKLTSIDLRNNPNLSWLFLVNIQLTSIDLSKNPNLTHLALSYNKLSSIDLSKNTNLTDLYLVNNELMSIDLSKNTKLKHLYLSRNQLSSIDLSKNTNLTQLYLDGNRLTSIDLRNNPNITTLDLLNNPLTNDIYIYKNKTKSVDILAIKSNYDSEVQNVVSKSNEINFSGSNNSVSSAKAGDYGLKLKYKLKNSTTYITPNSFDITYNIHVIEATSNKYIINDEEKYIYTFSDLDINKILNKINVNYATKEIIDNKLEIKYQNELLESYLLRNINFGKFKAGSGKIAIDENVSYQDFTREITTNGVSYKMFNGDNEVIDGNIELGMVLKVYYNSTLLETYEITNEYLVFDSNLNVNEDKKSLKNNIDVKVSDIISNIDTSGNVSIINNKNQVISGNTKIGTGYKLRVQLKNEVLEYTFIIKGDITGTGNITMSDVMKSATHVFDNNTITGSEYLEAADITGDGKIKMNDVMKLATFVLEGGSL